MSRLAASAALALALATPAGAAFEHPQDPRYGEVLYQFYQGDYFSSLTHLLAFDTRTDFGPHAKDATLLEGGLKLSFGLLDEAETVFQRELTPDVPAPVRNRAWYVLAKTAYHRGQLDLASRAMAHVQGEVPEELRGKQQLLSALLHMEQGRYQQAVAALRDWQGRPEEAPYARYNLGVALVRAGRLEEGGALLDALGRMQADSEELWSLRDKANVALGYALLTEHPDRAQAYLGRVRLDGALSNQALLGMSHAREEASSASASITPFAELTARPVSDPAVQEALLALPYALVQVAAYGEAADAYQHAISALEAERARLEAADKAISRGELLEVALQSPDASPPVETVPGRDYLGQVLSSHRFREAIAEYRDLLALRANLDYWSRNMAHYDAVLAAHRERFEERAQAAEAKLAQLDLGRLQSELRELRHDMERSAASGDQRGGEDARSQLAELGRARSRLLEAERGMGTRLSQLAYRIAAMKRRVATLQPAAEQALSHQARLIEDMALTELKRRRRYLDRQMGDARYALARLYDQLASREEEP